MATQSIECQIAKSQLGRYLNGDVFSEDALRQLEGHLVDCEDCAKELRARRRALQTLLAPVHAVVESAEPVEAARPTSSSKPNLIELLREKSAPARAVIPNPAPTAPAPPPTPEHTAQVAKVTVATEREPARPLLPSWIGSKAIAYTVALGALLLSMNTWLKNPTQLMGPRVAASTSSPSSLAPASSSESAARGGFDDLLPAPLAALAAAFEATPEAQQATVNHSERLKTMFSEPEPVAPAPNPGPLNASRRTPTVTAPRRRVPRRTPAPAPARRAEPRAPERSGITLYPPEVNP